MPYSAQFINASQHIENEISRLMQGRTTYNPFVNSSDLKIQILNRLLQVMWAPESFSKEELRFYFKDVNSEKLIPKPFPEIIDALLEDSTDCTVGDPVKIVKVQNKNIIKQNRNIFTKHKTTQSDSFYNDLKNQFSDIFVSPSTRIKYKLLPYKEDIDIQADVGKLFVRWNHETQALDYKTINPEGNIVTNSIPEATLRLKLGARFVAFQEAVQHNKMKRFLSNILEITAENGDTHPISPRPAFKRMLYLGDSLTDRGEMYDSILGRWSGLIGTSPHKSFSNAGVWAVGVDNLMADELLVRVVAEHLGILDYKDRSTCTNEEIHAINETILNLSKHIREKYKASFKLDDDSRFTIKNDANEDVVFSITRAIGGLTAYNYAGMFSFNIVRFITRFLLSTLASQVKKLLQIEEHTSQEDKDQTIIHILAGANDLVTVNARPSHKEVDRAVDSIIEQMENLWDHGFKKFAVSDLPDLSKTPRYQTLDRREQINAKICTEYYNKQLAMRLAQFKHAHENSHADIFSLHDLLQDGINNPSKYGFSTKYALINTQQKNWEQLNYHSKGASFYRISPNDNKTIENGQIAYVLKDHTLTYIDKTQQEPVESTFVLTDEELEEFNKKIKCADAVSMLPENKLATISSFLTKKAKREGQEVLTHFKPTFKPLKNKIYYQIENDTLNYQVMDCYERLRKGAVSKDALETQINGCALLKSTISPVNDLGKVCIDVPSANTFVRFENTLYYLYRTDNINLNHFEAMAMDVSIEKLDEFDANFKPWYASKQLSDKEFTAACEMLDNSILPKSPRIQDIVLNNENANLYIPYIQALLAEKDHLIARGDLFTPAQNTKAFKQYLEESGPILPGDVMPTSNKAFNDDLHPLGDFGAIWADKFYNEFLLKHYQYAPDARQFMGYMDGDENRNNDDLRVVI